jgi:RNA polymerase sigma-70 factor (ECF subfamily)
MEATGGNSDDQLRVGLDAARRGVEAGFTEIYRLFAGKVAGYLAGRGVADHEDVTNEVFLGAFRNLDNFVGGPSEFRAWLFGIAWNKSSDWHRLNARRPGISEQHGAASLELEGGDAETDAIAELAACDVDRLMATLTNDQRDVITLRVLADLSLQEVSHTLGKPVGAIKALQRRALAALHREISASPVSPGAE